MYLNGAGVPQDYVEAVRWYRLAADQEVAGAQFSLGIMYANGRGVPEDEAVRRCVWHRIETWDFRDDSVKFELSRVEK